MCGMDEASDPVVTIAIGWAVHNAVTGEVLQSGLTGMGKTEPKEEGRS